MGTVGTLIGSPKANTPGGAATLASSFFASPRPGHRWALPLVLLTSLANSNPRHPVSAANSGQDLRLRCSEVLTEGPQALVAG